MVLNQWHQMKLPPAIAGLRPIRVSCPFSANWSTVPRRNRILLVVRAPSAADINKKRLAILHETLLHNLTDRAIKIAKRWNQIDGEPALEEMAFGIVAWMPGHSERSSTSAGNFSWAHDALHMACKKMKPGRLHFLCNDVLDTLIGSPIYHRGWIKEIEIGGQVLPVSANLDLPTIRVFKRMYGDRAVINLDDANLLGHMSDMLAILIMDRCPWSLAHLQPRIRVLRTISEVRALFNKMIQHPFALDLETENLSVHKNAMLTMQIAFNERRSYMVPMKHMSSPWTPKELRFIYRRLRHILWDRDPYIMDDMYMVGQNLSFDGRILRQELGLPVIKWRLWDIMSGEYCMDENMGRIRYMTGGGVWGLDSILARYQNDFYFDSDHNKKGTAMQFATSPTLTKNMLKYAGMDVQAPFAIHTMQRRRAHAEDRDGGKRFSRLMLGLWSDTTHFLSSLEQNGAYVDVKYLHNEVNPGTGAIYQEMGKYLDDLKDTPGVRKTEKLLTKKTGPGLFGDMSAFDVRNTKHKELLFFDVLKLSADATSSGRRSMNKAFKKKHKAVPEVALWSIYEKGMDIQSTINSYCKIFASGDSNGSANPDSLLDHRIHSSYGYFNVVTGRTSSWNPNLQNIPEHGQYAKNAKRVFVSPDGTVTVRMDYSTHEILCWCQLSGDPKMSEMFHKIRGILEAHAIHPTDESQRMLKFADPHRMSYNTFTGTPVEEVTDTQRQSTKAIVFGAIFGKHQRTMAKELGISEREMEAIYDKYFGAHPVARDYLSDVQKSARKDLYIANQMGHRRHLYGYMAGLSSLDSELDRRATNAPIQGFASQVSCIAGRLINLDLASDAHLDDRNDWNGSSFDPPAFAAQIAKYVHDAHYLYIQSGPVGEYMDRMKYWAEDGLVEYTSVLYDIDWSVVPWVSFEIGDTADKMVALDGTEKMLEDSLAELVNQQKARLFKASRAEVM